MDKNDDASNSSQAIDGGLPKEMNSGSNSPLSDDDSMDSPAMTYVGFVSLEANNEIMDSPKTESNISVFSPTKDGSQDSPQKLNGSTKTSSEENDGYDGVRTANASYFMQTTEDVAKALRAVASAVTVPTTRPSVVFSSREETADSPLHKLQRHFTKFVKGFSSPPEVKCPYNPEILTSQKRQWARFQTKSLYNKSSREPSRVFESMVIVGHPPHVDVEALESIAVSKAREDSRRTSAILNSHYEVHPSPLAEPQILFMYPPERPLPLKYKDLVSFCLPGGSQVRAVERTPSFSELNEILLGQEQLKESNQSFVFRLQVADDSTLYGCCVLVEEIVQKSSNLVSMLTGEKPSFSSLSRYILTTTRCYCILSRLPFFELHFGVLRSILIEERLESLTKGIDMINLLSTQDSHEEYDATEKLDNLSEEKYPAEDVVDLAKSSESSEVSPERVCDNLNASENRATELDVGTEVVTCSRNEKGLALDSDSEHASQENCNLSEDRVTVGKKSEMCITDTILPLLRGRLYEDSESPASFQDSPCDDRSSRNCAHEMDFEEPLCVGHEHLDNHSNILEWAKSKNYGSLQVICEYYRLKYPSRGSSLTFQPLEHLHPVKFLRPSETVLHIAGSTIDVRSCNTSLQAAEVHNALLAEEESTALSVWTVACICGCLSLENVITFFGATLLEKQIVIVCSNLGLLSASVLSVIPLIRPYQWHSLLMPVLPDEMEDFLDAPVPFIVGIRQKTADIQSRLSNVVLVDLNKNQVKASIPQLPERKELLASLRPYHSALVGESYLARKRPVYECTDVQVEAAKGFLAELRSYLDSLCSNLRSHTITNVQSNNDKVSLLLKESFLGSYTSRERPFMKLFVDTQLFSVHTDLVLSFYQKD